VKEIEGEGKLRVAEEVKVFEAEEVQLRGD